MRAPTILAVALLSFAPTALTQTAKGTAPANDHELTSAPQVGPPIALVNRLPACTADQLLLSTDEEGGDFHGMSHAGTLIVLRNNGTHVCRILPIAQASLLDKEGKPLGPFSTAPPHAIGMHPGPVVLPIAMAVSAELTATLYWVSGPVFSDSLCLSPNALALKFGNITLRTPLEGQLCGERTKGVFAELSRFAPDPIVQTPVH